MRLTQKLLKLLHRVFTKDPQSFLAFRLGYNGQLKWEVRDGSLITSVIGGTGVGITVDLTQYTLAQLATYLAAQTGYTVTALTSDYPTLSSMVLIDGTGDIAMSNGDHLNGYTSLLWSYLDANAFELKAAADQVVEMLKQMSTRSSAADRKKAGVFTWADPIGVSTTYNSVTKTAGTSAFDSGARSFQRHTNGCVAEFRSSELSSKIAGITTTPPVGYATAGIEFAFYWKANGDLSIIEGGTERGTFATYNPNTRARIEYDKESVRYYIDGAWVRTVTGQLDKVCLLAVSLQSPGASLLEVSFGPYGSAEGEWLDELGSYYAVPRLPGETDAFYGRRIIAEVLLPKGNNVAIAAALTQATGGRFARVIDAVDNPPGGADSLLGLFDAVFGFDFVTDDFSAYTASVLALIERLRYAGTHLRKIELNGTITDVMSADAWSDATMALDVNMLFSDNNLNLSVVRRYDGSFTYNGAIRYNSSDSDKISLTINTSGVITNEQF